mmetsp:Transcript_8125/g.15504  ORF Transcript_8125/g.15504 Transcript_8125/m.15504 type:complete len:129 (+) Transcript_8125:550-936(+)
MSLLCSRNTVVRQATRSSNITRITTMTRRPFSVTAVTRGIAAWDPSMGYSWQPPTPDVDVATTTPSCNSSTTSTARLWNHRQVPGHHSYPHHHHRPHTLLLATKKKHVTAWDWLFPSSVPHRAHSRRR